MLPRLVLSTHKCYLCFRQMAEILLDEEPWSRHVSHVKCALCGEYLIGDELRMQLLDVNHDLRISLSAATRQASEVGLPIELTRTNWKDLAESHRRSSVSTRVDKLLHLIARRTDRPGNSCEIAVDDDYILVDG